MVTVSRPRAPRTSIETATVMDASDIRIRIRTAKDGAPEAQGVIVHRNYREVARFTTDAAGFYDFVEPYTKTDKKQVIVFEFFLESGTEKATVTVDVFPADSAPKADDPQKVVLIRNHDGHGNFTVLIRVIKAQGYGLETDVDVLFEGGRFKRRTDARGFYSFKISRTIAPGENLPFRVFVSGIEDPATIKISRPRTRTTVPRGFNTAWLLGTNNGRATIMLCLAVFFWLFAIVIGIGQPLVHKNWFRGEDGLSKQEQTYNSVMNQYFPAKESATKPSFGKKVAKFFGAEENSPLAIQSTKVPGHWHHLIWKIAIIFTLIFLIYGPLSLREEIAEEIGRAVENLRDRDYAQAGDPWFEKLVAWSGAYAVASNKQSTISATTTSGTGSADFTSHDGHDKKGGWSSFPMHLASDAIVEILPAIFRAMFGR